MVKQKLRLGTVAFSPKGKWNAETEYKRLNVVRFLASSYYAKKDNVGQTPTLDSEYWGLLVEGGDVVNNPDEEDITTEVVNNEHVLKLSDRTYKPNAFSGKGYTILRKKKRVAHNGYLKITPNSDAISQNNTDSKLKFYLTEEGKCEVYINVGEGKQETLRALLNMSKIGLLTKFSSDLKSVTFKKNGFLDEKELTVYSNFGASESVFEIYNEVSSFKNNILIQDDINLENTIYEIKYDFDLDGKIIKIPSNCILFFNGGSFYNGKIFSDNKTTMVVNPPKIVKNVNDNIYWGKFYNTNGQELTYKFDVIDRPFKLSVPASPVEIRGARHFGINEYQIWLGIQFVDGKGFDECIVPDNIYSLKHAQNNSNALYTNIRFQAYISGTYNENINGTYVLSSESEKYIDSYKAYIKKKVYQLKQIWNIPDEAFVYMNNECSNMYLNDNWMQAHIDMAKYVKAELGDKIKVGTTNNNVRRINYFYGKSNAAFSSLMNADNMDCIGENMYLTFQDYLAKDSININVYDFITTSRRIFEIKKTLSCVHQRGFKKFALTETGFSPSVRGFGSPDYSGFDRDYLLYVLPAAWTIWLKELKIFANNIDFINLWSLPIQLDIDIHNSASDLMYNVFTSI